MAAFRISAERFGTRANEIRQVGMSAGIPVILADREMQSPIGGLAYRLHCIEGSRPEVSVPGTWINEYAESIVKSVICYSTSRWYLGIRKAESPITW